MKIRFRPVVGAILLTTLISFLIGSFAVWGSYRADLDLLDRNLNQVIAEPLMNPEDAIDEALASAEINSIDIAIAFIAPPTEITILREATQISQIFVGSKDLTRALSTPIFLQGNQHIRAIAMELPENEFLLFAISTQDLDRKVRSNQLRLLAFILIANFLASLIIIWNSKRNRVRNERERLQRMQEFLGDAAHELRTPLTVIRGYSELLALKKLPTVEDEKRAFERLGSEIARMDSLITDLLLLAELGETETITSSLFDLSEVLLLNIDRHTPKDSPVKITLKSKSKEIYLVIEDGGPGLTESAYGEGIRSLQRFERSRSRETGGSGLGMSIMSAVVALHKGELSLRKSPLGGLAIHIRLPMTR